MDATLSCWLVTRDGFPPPSDYVFTLKLEAVTLSLQGCTSSVQCGTHLTKFCVLFVVSLFCTELVLEVKELGLKEAQWFKCLLHLA